MSAEYDAYLLGHRSYVIRAWNWILENFESGFFDADTILKVTNNISHFHDQSKFDKAEYDAYDQHFFGERTNEVDRDFDYAWLHHIQNSPHHWEHWVLLENGVPKALDMPYEYILEMICDWWSFSWKKCDFYEIFNWYKSQQTLMIMSPKTRETVQTILKELKEKLDKHYGD